MAVVSLTRVADRRSAAATVESQDRGPATHRAEMGDQARAMLELAVDVEGGLSGLQDV